MREAKTWRKHGIERLYRQLHTDVYPDGLEIELALGYNNWVLVNFAEVLELAKLNGLAGELPADYLQRLEAMYDYQAYASMPNGQVPGLNDSGDASPAALLKAGYGYFPSRDDFLWLATGGKEGTTPQKTSAAFPYSGHYVMRSGWDKDARYLLFDAGPFGSGHQHEDKLHLIVCAYGRPLLLDAGNYMYDRSRWRRYVLSTRGHNTIRVDGQDQNRRADRATWVLAEPDHPSDGARPLDNLWVSRPAFDYAVGRYDSPYGSKPPIQVRHTRAVVFVKPDYWVLVDTLEPSDDKEHRYESLFHLNADDAAADPKTGAVATRSGRPTMTPLARSGRGVGGEGTARLIAPVSRSGRGVGGEGGDHAANVVVWPVAAAAKLDLSVVKGIEEEPVQGWANGPWCAVPTAVLTWNASGTVRVATVLYPLPPGRDCPIRSVAPLAVTSDGKPAADAMAIRIWFANGAEHTLLSPTVPAFPAADRRRDHAKRRQGGQSCRLAGRGHEARRGRGQGDRGGAGARLGQRSLARGPDGRAHLEGFRHSAGRDRPLPAAAQAGVPDPVRRSLGGDIRRQARRRRDGNPHLLCQRRGAHAAGSRPPRRAPPMRRHHDPIATLRPARDRRPRDGIPASRGGVSALSCCEAPLFSRSDAPLRNALPGSSASRGQLLWVAPSLASRSEPSGTAPCEAGASQREGNPAAWDPSRRSPNTLSSPYLRHATEDARAGGAMRTLRRGGPPCCFAQVPPRITPVYGRSG